VPAKFVVAYPLVYHYLGGLRHFVWDLHKIGNNADKTSLLEKDRVEQSSKVLLGVALALSTALAVV
jgi:succinate dehydrogenase (ubiquinone) cytochrome b560 subunit